MRLKRVQKWPQHCFIMQNIREIVNLGVDIRRPRFKRSQEFQVLLGIYNEILKVQGVSIKENRSKRHLWNMVKDYETYFKYTD